MGKFYDEIPEWIFEWIRKQHMFWVATAPLNAQGHVNVSPKGMTDCFHVINSKQVWYEDLTGSGIETISHIRENGRITIMFSAFEGPPRILRLFGVGTVHEYGTPEYDALIPIETRKPGSRAAIVIDVYQVGTSCGYAVPLYDFVKHRSRLLKWLEKCEISDRLLATSNEREQYEEKVLPSPDDDGHKGTGSATPPHASLRVYWLLKNMRSLDGLPGLSTAPDAILRIAPQGHFEEETRPMKRGPIFGDHASFASGFMSGVVAMFVLSAVLRRLKL